MEQKAKQYLTARKKHHVIYRTTCQVTGKYYVGMHSTDELNDGYIGSGKHLWQSIKKHGLDQHRYEITEHLESRELLRAREAELVTKELVNDSMCMNIALGGGGGWEHVNASINIIDRKRNSSLGGISTKVKIDTDENYRLLNSKRTSDANKRDYASGKRVSPGWRPIDSQLAWSAEARLKRTATKIKNNFQQGIKNSQFGTRWAWVNKNNTIKKIKLLDLEVHLSEGWQRGLKV
jgi:hypothetical protein